MAHRFPSREAREAYWREQIDAWSASGLKQAEFCRQRSISLWSLRSWRTRLSDSPKKRRRVKRSGFVPVHVLGEATTVEIVLTNGRVLRVPPGLDPQLVSQLAQALEPASC